MSHRVMSISFVTGSSLVTRISLCLISSSIVLRGLDNDHIRGELPPECDAVMGASQSTSVRERRARSRPLPSPLTVNCNKDLPPIPKYNRGDGQPYTEPRKLIFELDTPATPPSKASAAHTQDRSAARLSAVPMLPASRAKNSISALSRNYSFVSVPMCSPSGKGQTRLRCLGSKEAIMLAHS